MKLRSVAEVLDNTKGVLRMDLDLPMNDGKILDNSRLIKSISTIKLLLGKGCRIVVIGHLGRPEGKEEKFSLRPIYLELMSLLEPGGESVIESVFVEEVNDRDLVDQALAVNQIVVLENLRFWKGEENNDAEFLKNLTEICQFYVNDAFTVAHRKHRSIMLYKNLPGFYGLSFIEEAEKIGKIIEAPQKPLTIILGGAKEDKLSYLRELEKMADHILIGGKLPKLKDKSESESLKVVWADLREDGRDLSEADIDKFKEIIRSSKTIIWVGAMGMYEDINCRNGTEEIARAVAESGAYKIIAGGDTGASIVKLGLSDKIDLIASGGGVMLELLTKKKLPAWD